MTQASGKGWASVRDVCEYLRLSRMTVYNMMTAGKLRWAKFGRIRRVSWDAVREYELSRQEEQLAPGRAVRKTTNTILRFSPQTKPTEQATRLDP
jgi:excisionase family DNA binding protein